MFFAAHLVSITSDDLHVELVGLDEENTISVCEYLVTLGLAYDLDDDTHEAHCETIVPVNNEYGTPASKPPIPQRRKRPSLIIEEET